MRIIEKGLILIFVPLLVQILFIGVLAYLYQRSITASAEADKSRRVMSGAGTLAAMYSQAGQCLVNAAISRDPDMEKQFLAIVDEIPEDWSELEHECRDRPTQIANLKKILPRARQAVDVLLEAKHNLVQQGGVIEYFRGKHDQVTGELLQQVAKDLQAVSREEQRLYGQAPLRALASQSQLFNFAVAGVLLNFLLAAGLMVYFGIGIAKRLSLLSENSRRLALGESLVPIMGGHDEISRVDGAFHDMAIKLKLTEDRRQELVAIVAHDIRIPLSSLKAFFEAATLECLSHQHLRTKLNICEAEFNRLITLIDDLLMAEENRTDAIAMQFAVIDLQDVLSEAIAAIDYLAKAKSIAVQLLDKQEVWVLAAKDRLVQVMVNLLTNAIKYSPESCKIEISITSENDFVEVRVSDEGRGVPKEMRQRIFEKSVQVKEEDRQIGTGLGLYICKMIIVGHGGTIGVRDKELCSIDDERIACAGSVFWFRLPALAERS